ncbi:MAG: [FeFe] hydrogenase H-cluster radical SAM maturase HydG [Armatimonadota bacterium]
MAVIERHNEGIVPDLDIARIYELSKGGGEPQRGRIADILDKSLARGGLDLAETAELLRVRDPELREAVFQAARKVKEGIYGRRMVLFAPLYAGNACSNNCLYCAFRRDNTDLKRRTLTMEEIAAEVRGLERMGHKRVLLLTGESPQSPVSYAVDAVRTIYETKEGQGEIRRVNVNVAPLSVEDFRRLKEVGIGTYQCFQETYYPEQYAKLHPGGRKADYGWRLGVFDRAFAAGIDDVGLGVLYGLYDYRFDTLAVLAHAHYLDRRYGVGPHTISFPRVEPAQNAPAAEHIPYPTTDDEIMMAVAVIRLSCPYTGIIMTTRETPALRRELLGLGVSQLSAGSRTYPGGYAEGGGAHVEEAEQFTLGDTRTLDEVTRDLAESGYIPSFCTACYRLGRTGHDFMDKAKPGDIQSFCTPNAILTFQEYLSDYASPETRAAGEAVIDQALAEVRPELRQTVEERLRRIRGGTRDLYL